MSILTQRGNGASGICKINTSARHKSQCQTNKAQGVTNLGFLLEAAPALTPAGCLLILPLYIFITLFVHHAAICGMSPCEAWNTNGYPHQVLAAANMPR